MGLRGRLWATAVALFVCLCICFAQARVGGGQSYSAGSSPPASASTTSSDGKGWSLRDISPGDMDLEDVYYLALAVVFAAPALMLVWIAAPRDSATGKPSERLLGRCTIPVGVMVFVVSPMILIPLGFVFWLCLLPVFCLVTLIRYLRKSKSSFSAGPGKGRSSPRTNGD